MLAAQLVGQGLSDVPVGVTGVGRVTVTGGALQTSPFPCPANTMWRTLLYYRFHKPKAVTYHTNTMPL